MSPAILPFEGSVADPVEPTPDWLKYFTRQYLNETPAQKMAYLEGWQLDPQDPNYNMALAYLTGVQPHPQPTDVGPAGPRYHFADMTPGGQHLKAQTHPGYWWEDYTTLMKALNMVGRTQ